GGARRLPGEGGGAQRRRQRNAPAGQPPQQLPPGSGQPGVEGGHLPAQEPGGTGRVLPLQAAKDEGDAEGVGGGLDLLVEGGLQVGQGRLREGRGLGGGVGLAFVGPAAGGAALGFHGNSIGDAVQPAGQRLGLADGGGLAGQDEEGGLEGVLAVLLVAQD